MPGDVHAPPSQPATVFVGREREMVLLRAALADASAGQGRLVVVGGEPGIGKTRLAEELAHHATAQGATVRWGRCREGAGAPAFWPWIQILRAQIRDTDPGELRTQLVSGAQEIVRLVPDLHERLPEVPTAPLTDDAGARFRLFDSVVGFLRASAAARPLVLTLEDLHWAQTASVELLRFVAEEMREARILVVVTYRDIDLSEGHPLADVLGALPYQPLVQRMQLSGLSAAEIGQLIEALGHLGSADLVARVHRDSGGNPFFATEIVRGLGTAEPGVPGSVRDAVGHRLQQLSEPCRRLLDVAAVIGAEFRLATLERVAAEAGDRAPLLQLLGEAKEAHIVVEAPGSAGRYRFAHALIREVLYTGLPLEQRLPLHWHVATALEGLGAPTRQHGASELAHHFSEAIAACGDDAQRRTCVDKAVLYATKAAEQATAMAAYHEAVSHYEGALRILEEWRMGDRRQACELLLGMGEAQTRAGTKRALRSETFRRTAALAREAGEPQLLARAALCLAARVSLLEAAEGRHVALLREALAAVGPGDSSLRAELLACLALAAYFPDPPFESAPLSAEALSIARRLGKPSTLGLALRSRYVALPAPAQARERMALAKEILNLGEQFGDPEMVLYGRLYHLYEALALGEISTVERELAVFTRLADDLRQPFFRSQAVGMRAALALIAGRFVDAEERALEAMQLMQYAEDPAVADGCLQQVTLAYWERGKLGEVEGFLKATIERHPYVPTVRAVLAVFYAEEGRVEEASLEIERLSADDFGTLPQHRGWLAHVAMLANACAVLGDTTHAARLYELLAPYAPHLIVLMGGPICLGSVSFLLGLLAHTVGRWDDALTHLDEALSAHMRINSPPWVANTQWVTAAVLLARNDPGDRERAAELLAAVLQTTKELGMLRLQRKGLALREQLGVGPAATIDAIESRAASAPPGSPPFLRGHSQWGLLTPQPLKATFRKEGDYWVVGYKGPSVRLKDRIGLQYLAVLLRHPGREFLASDLVAAAHSGDSASACRHGARHAVLANPGPYFDAQAQREYARRLRDLQAAAAEAQDCNDLERASRAREEIDFLTEELQRGIGFGRRIRSAGSPIERARVSVTHAIKTALRGIAAHNAALGQYLAATIKTGTFCSYGPDPRVEIVWEL